MCFVYTPLRLGDWQQKIMILLSLNSASLCSAPCTKGLQFSPTKVPFGVSKILGARCCSISSGGEKRETITNYAGVQLEETVDTKAGKLRLDSWISSRIDGISRARVQSSIRSGLVAVNGQVVSKVSSLLFLGLPSSILLIIIFIIKGAGWVFSYF